MTATSRMHLLVAAVVSVVIAFAVADWILMPAKSGTWLIAIGTALGMWLVVTMIGRARSFEEYSASERSFLSTSIVAAGVILSAALLRHMLTSFGVSDSEPFDRAIGVGIGVTLVLLGNTTPKILAPLTAKRCAPSVVQSVQRFAGWVFVLDGFICIAAALFLPVGEGRDLYTIATGIALALVLSRYAWAFFGSSPGSSPTSS